jgi:hypothetical protein
MPIVRAPALFGVLLVGLLALVHPQAKTPDLTAFFTQVQAALAADSPDAYLALVAPTEGGDFAPAMVDEIRVPGTTNVTLRERDRAQLAGALPGEGFRVIVEILTERGQQARLATWRVDIKLVGGDVPVWRIVDQERLSSIDGLFRLALDTATQYDVSNLTVQATDLRLEMSSGHAFVARTLQGVTALVLRGRGLMRFTPPPSEHAQLRIFAGSEALVTEFDTAFIRLNPATFDERVTRGALHPREVNDRDLRRAQSVFTEMVRKTYMLNFTDMGLDSWSLLPSGRDMVAEVHTKRFDTLTYALAAQEAEDVSLFDRKKRHNISSYASPEKLDARGRFYNEDDLVDYDVLDYKVNATFDPRREWIDGQTTVTLRVTAPAVSTITLLLEEDLVVRAVSSSEFGRLMFLRIVGQDNLIVNLPTFVMKGSELDLTVSYGGRLPAQQLEEEAIVVAKDPLGVPLLETAIPAEPHYVYSNRVHWYPRSQVHDYALATLRITLPEDYACVATGVQAVGLPIRLPETAERPASTTFVFIVGEPARYLSVVISKFVPIEPLEDTTSTPLSTGGGRTATLAVETNPHQQSRGRSLQPIARTILDFYTGIMGDAPYPQFTLAVIESRLPGGHSPAYFAVLNQPLPSTQFRWRNDPVSFDNFPSFFLAHEIAHQWWGQAVGWKNYHEQWLSEGTAQYFAALWVAHDRGADSFGSLMRQMRDWSLRYSDQGPIHLGYRLGHVKGESRIFRALVYNKAAVVLHMLRRLLGDETFFAGLRSFYQEFKYRKAGSDDLRRSMEAASGVPLESFFEQWIYGSAIPRLRVSSRIQQEDGRRAGTVTVRFEQTGRPFNVPVTVTLLFESGDRQDVVVKVAGRVTEATIPFDKPLHRVLFNDDNAALAEIDD